MRSELHLNTQAIVTPKVIFMRYSYDIFCVLVLSCRAMKNILVECYYRVFAHGIGLKASKL
jgi:hypothetical protein